MLICGRSHPIPSELSFLYPHHHYCTLFVLNFSFISSFSSSFSPEPFSYFSGEHDGIRLVLQVLLQVHHNSRLCSFVFMVKPSNPQTQMFNRIFLHSSLKSIPKFLLKFHHPLLRSASQKPEQRQIRLLWHYLSQLHAPRRSSAPGW